MRFAATVASLAALASVTVASPDHRMIKAKRADAAVTDTEILNYALTLEYLERAFYREAIKKFSSSDFTKAGYPSNLYNRVKVIGSHEESHVSLLAGALGDNGVKECKYNFGITDVDSFLGIARILETVGVTAYLGAAPDIQNKAYLAVAGSILTIEARHTSYLNDITGISPFPSPYDPALYYSQVYTLAAGFIVPGSCGKGGSLPPGIHAYPTLEIKTAKPQNGELIGLHFPIPKGYTGPYYVQVITGSARTTARINMKNGVARLPDAGQSGLAFLIVTRDTKAPTDSNTIAGPAIAFL